jgi:thioredoxin 1
MSMLSSPTISTRIGALVPARRVRGQRLPVAFSAGGRDAELKRMEEFRAGLQSSLNKSMTTRTFAASDAPEQGGDLIEVELDDYENTVETLSADGKVLVMDFYTQWCGPCKLMKPTLVEWADSMAADGVSFRSFEASKKNAPVGKALGIKSVPTLIVYQNGEEISRVVGNKLPALKEAIDAALGK